MGKLFEAIYYDPSKAGSFSEPDKVYRYVRKEGKYVISKHKILKWLKRQEAYSLQQLVLRRFQRKKATTTGIDDQWDADLMDMSKYAPKNAYILVVIEIFSKYTWLRPLKNKKGNAMSRAFVEILEEGMCTNRPRTDKEQ